MKSGIVSRVLIIVIGILLTFGCGLADSRAWADIAPVIRYKSDPFFENIEEITYIAHTVLDIKNLQVIEDIQNKNSSLRNEFFRKALRDTLEKGLSKEVQEKIKINDLKAKRLPRSEIYTANQILVEVTYAFGRKVIDSKSYIVGAVYGNVWRLPEDKCIGENLSGYHGTLTGVQPVAYFLFREDDTNSQNEIRSAVEKAISEIIKVINYNLSNADVQKGGEFYNEQEK